MNDDAGHDDLPLAVDLKIDQLCDAFEAAWRAGQIPDIEEYSLGVAEAYRSILHQRLHSVAAEYRRNAEATTIRRHNSVNAAAEDDLHDDDVSLPSKIGRFPVERELGRGAFSRVFLARHIELNVKVAIKVPLRSRFKDDDDRARFEREAQNAARLGRHPGFVKVFEIGESDGLPYIVLEFIEGVDLSKRLSKAWPVNESAKLISGVARAITFAHQHGLVHCDLKPENILISADGRPVVADFGLSVPEEKQRNLRGDVFGTVPYMSPEQAGGCAHRLDGRSDIWSVGVILYELVTGRRPFNGRTTDELEDEIENRDPKPASQCNPEVPPGLDRIIARCLAKNVADRYSNAEQLARDLERLIAPRRHWWWIAAAMPALLLIVFGTFWRLNAPPPVPPDQLVDSFRVLHIGGEDDRPLGEIGPQSNTARENEAVKVLAVFREPVYCYLIALNPDGSQQLCCPVRNKSDTEVGDEESRPALVTSLQYPSAPRMVFRLTDGAGQQAFALIASRRSLPSYREWKEKLGPIPWNHSQDDSVLAFDGQTTIPVFAPKERGKVEKMRGADPFDQMCRFLKANSGAEIVQARAFPVLEGTQETEP
jgi:serine/threonine protein kinase